MFGRTAGSAISAADRQFELHQSVEKCGRCNWHNGSKAVPQHTYGGAGGRGCIAPTHSRIRQ
jgi:hypothetical protein